MLPTIGVIGVEDVVAEILEFARAFPQYKFLSLPYQDENETLSIFERNRGRMDVCLFSGSWPYFKVSSQSDVPAGMPLVYVADAASGIHRTLATMALAGIDVTRLSIDTLLPDEASEVFAEIGLEATNLRLLPVNSAMQRKEFVEFHRSAWMKGETTGGITFLRSAYAPLAATGMPIHRCTPNRGAVKEAVVKAVVEAQNIQSRSAQLVVGLVEVGHRGGSADQVYARPRQKAILLQALLEWGEPHGISVVPMEGIRFSLFLTRGVLEELTGGYVDLPDVRRIAAACSETVYFGFGVAPSASLCHANALSALNYAKETGASCGFAALDDGRVVGPLGTTDRLAFRRSTVDPVLLAKADTSGLSLATIGKVQSLLRKNGSLLITAEQMSAGLGICKRNARRILSHLQRAGMAGVAGLDQQGTRGRPQHIYRITLDEEP